MNTPSLAASGEIGAHRPANRALGLGVVLAILLLLGAGTFAALRYFHPAGPQQVLAILDGIETPADVQRNDAYMTAQGREVLLWLTALQHDKPYRSVKNTYGEPIFTGNVCEVHGLRENFAFTIRMLKGPRWQFDDIHVDSIEGQKADVWLSAMRDHPLSTVWTFIKQQF